MAAPRPPAPGGCVLSLRHSAAQGSGGRAQSTAPPHPPQGQSSCLIWTDGRTGEQGGRSRRSVVEGKGLGEEAPLRHGWNRKPRCAQTRAPPHPAAPSCSPKPGKRDSSLFLRPRSLKGENKASRLREKAARNRHVASLNPWKKRAAVVLSPTSPRSGALHSAGTRPPWGRQRASHKGPATPGPPAAPPQPASARLAWAGAGGGERGPGQPGPPPAGPAGLGRPRAPASDPDVPTFQGPSATRRPGFKGES